MQKRKDTKISLSAFASLRDNYNLSKILHHHIIFKGRVHIAPLKKGGWGDLLRRSQTANWD
ncbi:hypothetical protein C7Y66_15440 [Chroococcidiopsis sp. CCALA 051]|nr:hypothetical protein C7Y66_15440 [Chroococcidiopsis sp. CCALA 051]